MDKTLNKKQTLVKDGDLRKILNGLMDEIAKRKKALQDDETKENWFALAKYWIGQIIVGLLCSERSLVFLHPPHLHDQSCYHCHNPQDDDIDPAVTDQEEEVMAEYEKFQQKYPEGEISKEAFLKTMKVYPIESVQYCLFHK